MRRRRLTSSLVCAWSGGGAASSCSPAGICIRPCATRLRSPAGASIFAPSTSMIWPIVEGRRSPTARARARRCVIFGAWWISRQCRTRLSRCTTTRRSPTASRFSLRAPTATRAHQGELRGLQRAHLSPLPSDRCWRRAKYEARWDRSPQYDDLAVRHENRARLQIQKIYVFQVFEAEVRRSLQAAGSVLDRATSAYADLRHDACE